MKRLLIISAALILTLLPFAGSITAQSKSNTKTGAGFSFNPAPYRVGERLTYNVSFSNFINAAHIELFTAARGQFFNRDALQLRARVETTEVVGVALFSLNTDYIAYVDPASGLPFRTQQINHDATQMASTPDNSNLPAGATAIPAQSAREGFPTTYDFLSAIFRLRALPLADGATYRFSAQQGDQYGYSAELRVIGHELIKTSVGSYNTIVTQVRVPRDAAANSYRLQIYFSDDERHVPVRLTAQHPAGEIRAELASAELLNVPPASNQPTLPPGRVAQTPPVNPSPVINTPRVATPATPQLPSTNSVGDASAKGSLPPGLPFDIGEQLNYNVFLANSAAPVGTASFQVRARQNYFNRNGVLLSAQAVTNPAAQRIFFASDQINSYVDATTLLPFRTQLALREGKRNINETVTFDQDRGNAITGKGTRLEIPVGTHDIISVLYALRSFDLTKRNAVSLLVNNRALTFFVAPVRRETIQLNNQSIETVQLSLTTDDPQGDKFGLRLWVSTDRRRLPLRAAAATQLGAVRADLSIIPVLRQ
ncbi:MAG: DUF3108 domain-containing protein [Pyrinomonadaceae bacterium]